MWILSFLQAFNYRWYQSDSSMKFLIFNNYFLCINDWVTDLLQMFWFLFPYGFHLDFSSALAKWKRGASSNLTGSSVSTTKHYLILGNRMEIRNRTHLTLKLLVVVMKGSFLILRYLFWPYSRPADRHQWQDSVWGPSVCLSALFSSREVDFLIDCPAKWAPLSEELGSRTHTHTVSDFSSPYDL